jgi:predicted aspartyl protease
VTFFSLGICKGRPEFFEQQYTRTRLAELFTEARWKLDSQQKYKEVRVPFSQKTGWIYVQALWAGKPVKCVLDTGATYISWPKTLGLAATPTGILAQSNGIGEHRVLGEWVSVQSLEIGRVQTSEHTHDFK